MDFAKVRTLPMLVSHANALLTCNAFKPKEHPRRRSVPCQSPLNLFWTESCINVWKLEFYHILIYSPSSPRVNRPRTAAAALPMDAGQIKNENAKGRLSILVYYLIPRHRSAYDLRNLTPVSV